MSQDKKKRLLGILLFDDVEVLDFCGPFEVFSIAGNLFEDAFKVVIVAKKAQITARNGLKIVADYVIGTSEIPKLDILLVPGGYGTVPAAKDEQLIGWVKSVGNEADFVLSVCTGVSLLGKAGLIEGMTVTTHHLAFEEVKPDIGTAQFCKCRRFVDNGRVLTSAGVSAGIDLALYFVKKRLGEAAAKEVTKHMEYNWKDFDVEICSCKFN